MRRMRRAMREAQRSAKLQMRRTFFLVVAALLLAQVAVIAPASGGGRNRAGVVVEHGDGSQEVRCVKFTDAQINGFQLLGRSELRVKKAKFDFGAAICWLDGEGCKTERRNKCFDCDGEPGFDPQFWGYWTQEEGQTTPTEAFIGAKDRVVSDGDVDYWKYNESTFPDPQPAPDARTLDDICSTGT